MEKLYFFYYFQESSCFIGNLNKKERKKRDEKLRGCTAALY